MNKILDIYTDYLICQNSYATATGLPEMLCGYVSHDQFTRFLNKEALGSKDLREYVKPEARRNEKQSDGVLILDDSIEEKPYTDENEIMFWHYSHAKGRHVKGVNILSCLVRYGKVSLPIGYRIIHKDIVFCDIETKKEMKKASLTKNERFRNLVKQGYTNKVLFDYVLSDNWFGAKDNLEYIHNLQKYFIIGIKSNRIIALSEDSKKKGQFQKVSSLTLEEGKSVKVWLKGIKFPVLLFKKIFINEDNSTGVLYLVFNDINHDAEHLYGIYQKRWRIETYHKSGKQNASLAKSLTKKVISQSNHIFASIIAFCKLEMLQLKTSLNHFALKYKLILKANQAAMTELQNLHKLIVAA